MKMNWTVENMVRAGFGLALALVLGASMYRTVNVFDKHEKEAAGAAAIISAAAGEGSVAAVAGGLTEMVVR